MNGKIEMSMEQRVIVSILVDARLAVLAERKQGLIDASHLKQVTVDGVVAMIEGDIAELEVINKKLGFL